jgi:hypothetical protein
MLLITTFVELREVAGRSRTRADCPQAVSGRPILIHNAMPSCAVALSRRFQKSIIVARHGRCMTCVNQTRPHCVNQMGKTQYKLLLARRGRGTAQSPHGCGMTYVNKARPNCVNQKGRTQSKPLAARHGRGMAVERHGHCMVCVNQ